ncbi:MAG: hypothetical protein ABIK07_10385 [Planctomycetota bacterium]
MANRSQKKKLAIVLTLFCCLIFSLYALKITDSMLDFMVENKTSEEHMRKVAWWILAFADENGKFPSNNDELLIFKASDELSHSLLNDSTLEFRKYPITTTEARTHGTQSSDIRYSLQIVIVNYSDNPGIAPSLSVNQQSEERDRELVNSWLRHAQKYLNSN